MLRDGATWTAIGTTLTGSGLGASVEFTAGSTSVAVPTNAVRAAIGAATCQASALVLPEPSAGSVAVSVIDALTGRPVPGAKVLLSSTAGGVIAQAAGDTVETDARGYATLALVGAPASYSVSVFHPDFSYLTVANYAGSSRFLSFALRRNAQDTYGGYRGTFNNVPGTSNVHQAMAATSLGGDFTLTPLERVQGPMVPTDIVIGSAINQQDVPVAAGRFFGFGNQPIKDQVAAQGLNGTCVGAAGTPDETRIAAGTCGTRSAWALSADVPLGDLPIDAIAGGLENANFPALIDRIVPTFRRLHSSVVRDVQFTLRATPFLDAGVPDYTDQSQYTTVNHDFTQLRAAFDFAVRLPVLPRLKGSFVPGAMVLGGAHAPGRGVLALGVGAAADSTPIDGRVSANGLASGLMRIRMAPTHQGLEGAPYGLLVSALTNRCMRDFVSTSLFWGEALECEATSTIVARLPGNKLVFDQAGAAPVDLSTRAFPPFPEGARFNFANAADRALPGRSFRLTNVLLTGLQVGRISFTDGLNSRWEVLVDAASPSFTLPPVPGALRDRLFSNGNSSTGARAALTVSALQLRRDPSVSSSTPVSFTEFVEFNDTNADRTTELLTGYSTLDYGSPLITFTTPASSFTTIARGARLVLRVRDFSIGTSPGTDDGVVRLSFTGATGCPDVVLSTEVPQPGSGQVEHTLPVGCFGNGLSIRAELVKTDGVTPLVPAVASTLTVTVQ